MIPRWVDRYVGIPFAEGSSLDGCHCWGLVALVFSERAGIELDRYEDIASDDLLRVARQLAKGKATLDWRQVSEPQALDVALMHSRMARGVINHVGVFVTPTHILHIERGINSLVVPLDHFSIKDRRVVSFHRHISQ